MTTSDHSWLERRYAEPSSTFGLALFFLALQVTGLLCITSTLLVVLCSSKVRRQATWLSFYFTWLVFATSYILLFLAGKDRGPEPSFRLCLAQAALIYGTPVLCGAASTTLILQVWFDHLCLWPEKTEAPLFVRTTSLVLAPYVVFAAILTEVTYIGSKSPQDVRRMGEFAYCVVTTGLPGKVSACFVATSLIVNIVFLALIARSFVRHHKAMQAVSNGRQSLSIIIRLGIFGFVMLVVLGVVAAFSKPELNRSVPDGIICPLPLIVFLIFGTQQDIRGACIFWRPRISPGQRVIQPAEKDAPFEIA